MANHILIYVQHLLGSGHYVRAYHLANALAHENHQVHLITGGFPVTLNVNNQSDGLHIIQLPPIRSPDEHFTSLVTDDNQAIDDNFKAHRLNQLLRYAQSQFFDYAIIETFPFGRRQLRHEITALLDTLKNQNPNCHIMSSIRDILQRRKLKREQETIHHLNQYFDKVLVHADNNITELSDSFVLADKINDMIYYTGYVYPSDAKHLKRHQEFRPRSKSQTILVAAGGSNQGFTVLKAAILASKQMSSTSYHWHILYSENLSTDEKNSLIELSALQTNITCEPNRHDYTKLLAEADLSISYAGYNTVLDVLIAGTKAVLIPFNKGNETEQTDRANSLVNRKRVVMYDPTTMNIDQFVDCIEQAFALSTTHFTIPNIDGIAQSCHYIRSHINQQKHHTERYEP